MKVPDIKEIISTPGTFTMLLYFLGMGLMDVLIRTMLQGGTNISLYHIYVNSLLFALFFGILIILWETILPADKGGKDAIIRYYWIIAMNPLVSYLLPGRISESIIHDGVIGIIFILIPLLTVIGFKVGISKRLPRYLIFSSMSVILSLPALTINRVAVLAGDVPQFKLYEVLSVDLYLQSGWTYDLLVNQRYHLMIILLLAEVLVVYLLLAYRYYLPTLKNFIRTIKPFRTLHFIMMIFVGAIYLDWIAPEVSLKIIAINHIPYLITAALCAVMVWQFTTMLNDFYDTKIDSLVHPDRPLVSGSMPVTTYFDLLLLICFLSILLSLTLGSLIMLLNLIALSLAIIYSAPPIRLRDRLYGHICVGLGSLVGFYFGVYSPVYWRHGIYFTSRIDYRNIPYYPDVFFASLLIVTVLSISPLINALSDYEGDKNSGVKNVYTVLGLERGKKLVSVLIILLFISPLGLFAHMQDMVFLLTTGLISSVIFYKLEDHRPVFGMYFLVLIYLLLRFLSFI